MRPRTLGHHFSISQRENLSAARRANRVVGKREGERERRSSCAQSRDLLFVSVVMMSYKKADEREREREGVCNVGLPLRSAPGVVSSSIEVLGDRERENDLAD